MKNTFDDISLTKAAKSLVDSVAMEYSPEKLEMTQPCIEDNTIGIKIAKAKAGARRHINRTIRICAVAAVLMIGIVCALFMGAENDEIPADIKINATAYMWKNYDADYEYTMPVNVDIDLEIEDRKDSRELVFNGDITVKDVDGNYLVEYYGVELRLEEENNSAVFWEYERKILRNDKGEYDSESIKKIIPFDMGRVTIYFYDDWKKFEICYQQSPSQVLGEYTVAYLTDDAVFINCDATNREEAVDICRDNFENKIKGSEIIDWYRENIKFE